MSLRKVVVVGGGIVGMSTALQIQNIVPNVCVTLISEKLSPETTGDVSAGLWQPYLLQDTPPNLVR